ncbi:LAFA_0E18470g1_1 [Lachancea sp. 'fantastica']|nr:LAFA_0E18470g1_1 [Lachancea sp. 'fantastica']
MALPYVERILRIKTRQSIVGGRKLSAELPTRKWQVDLWILGPNGEEIPANIFEKCTYRLHPTFPQPILTMTEPPFALKQRGWGEFSYPIQCFFLNGGGEVEILHDLSFQESSYYSDIRIKVPTHIPALREALSLSGPVPSVVEATSVDSDAMSDLDNCIKKLVAGNEELVTDVVNLILHHPSVSRQLEKVGVADQFVFGLHQLPDFLLKEVSQFIDKRR